MSKRIFLLACLLAIAVVLLASVSCDSGPTITYENRTSSTVWIDVDLVPHEFTGWFTPQEERIDNGPIPPGESRSFVYFDIPMGQELGERYGKYVISAIVKEGDDTVGTVIWQRIYTWTELDDMGWEVIIELE
jgi:hypothetical protein